MARRAEQWKGLLSEAGRFPFFEIGWGAAFVEIDEVEHGDGFLVAMLEPGFLEAEGNALAGFVAPAAFLHEGIPDFDVGGVEVAAVVKTPLEDLFVMKGGLGQQ